MVRKAFLLEGNFRRPDMVLFEAEGHYCIVNTYTREKRKIDEDAFNMLTKGSIPIAYVDDRWWLRERVQKRIDELVDNAIKEGRDLNDLEERWNIVEQACREVFDMILKEAGIEDIEFDGNMVFVRHEVGDGAFQYFAYRDKPHRIIEDPGEETKRIWDKVYGYSLQPRL
ncbi:MAG: hypothetical protein QW733_03950 [Desulfurococcaceae archaeon]